MREANELKIGAAIRRELSSRRVDLTKLKFPVKAGEVTLQGELSFIGLEKTADEIAIELKFIESSIESIEGVSKTNFELTNWKKSDTGIWEPAVSLNNNSSNTSAKSIVGEGFICPECDFVIRFCPCCGKPLALGEKPGSHRGGFAKINRKPLPPIKPIAKKHSTPVPVVPPLTSTPLASNSAIDKTTDKTMEPVSVQPIVSEVKSIEAKTVETKENNNSAEKPFIAPKPLKPLKPLAPLKPLKPIGKPIPQASEEKAGLSETQSESSPTAQPLAGNGFAQSLNEGLDTNPINESKVAIPNFMSETAENSAMPNFQQPMMQEQAKVPPDVPPTLNLNMDFDLGSSPAPRPDNKDLHPMASLDLDIENMQVQPPVVPDLNMGNLGNQPPMSDLGMGNLGNQPPMSDFGMGNLGNQPPMPDFGMSNLGNQSPMSDFSMPNMQEQQPIPDLGIGLSMDLPETSGQAAIPDLGLGLDMNLSAMPESASIPNLGITASEGNLPEATNQTAPDFNFGNLDDLGLTSSMEQEDTPLPPMKPAPVASKSNQIPQPPQGLSFDNLGDDDTPLPPMKSAQPAPKKAPPKKNNDIFASLFNDSDLGGGASGMDDNNLDLNLDVLEIFPNGDQSSPSSTAKSAPKPKAQPQQASESDPFNLDNVLDLDSMMGTGNPASGGKDDTGTFNLDDFDISKFKL